MLGLDESQRRAEKLIQDAQHALRLFGAQAELLAVVGALRAGKEPLSRDTSVVVPNRGTSGAARHVGQRPEGTGREVREVLCNLVTQRTAHFASNLGVVELCLALHSVFDFRRDRLIWDTGHQIYPHKLVTGRYDEFATIRTRGGLMGYPNPAESDYDLFMTGHAGLQRSTALGLKSGDDLLGRTDRHAVAVIGDGAFPSGIVFEAMNNAGGLKKNLLVILNDNKMSICPRVGGLAGYLDRLRTNPFYTGLKSEVAKMLNLVPLFGDPAERFLAQMKDAIKAGLHGGMLFEDLGFRYLGPVDGHDLRCAEVPEDGPGPGGPGPAARGDRKGPRLPAGRRRPGVLPHAARLQGCLRGRSEPCREPGRRPTPTCARDAIREQMIRDPQVAVLTAAMCQGNMLEPVRDEFPDRFFDVGICESHAVAFAAGLAKAGCARSSTSTARSCSGASTRSSRKWPCRTCRSCSAGSRRAGRSRRPDPSRRVRPGLPARVSEPGRDGARRCARSGGDARLGLASRRPLPIRYPKATARDGARRSGHRSSWAGRKC